MDRPPELQVLHDSGRVLRVVHSVQGVLDRHREPFDDAPAKAAELLEAEDVHRVVLIDRSGLRGLWERIDSFGSPDHTQPELLWSANEAFWSHPCVTTAPEPSASPWPALAHRVNSLGDFKALLGVWRGDDLFLSFVATFRGGLMTELTSVRGPRPSRTNATSLLDFHPDAALVLLCELRQLEDTLSQPDLTGALVRMLNEGGCIAQRGVEEVLCKPSG